jgi:hypothetical protein
MHPSWLQAGGLDAFSDNHELAFAHSHREIGTSDRFLDMPGKAAQNSVTCCPPKGPIESCKSSNSIINTVKGRFGPVAATGFVRGALSSTSDNQR